MVNFKSFAVLFGFHLVLIVAINMTFFCKFENSSTSCDDVVMIHV